jgi:hypothetical protein
VFENSGIMSMFKQKTEEVAGGGGRVHNEELHDLYCLSSMRMMKDGWQDGWGMWHAWERGEYHGEV